MKSTMFWKAIRYLHLCNLRHHIHYTLWLTHFEGDQCSFALKSYGKSSFLGRVIESSLQPLYLLDMGSREMSRSEINKIHKLLHLSCWLWVHSERAACGEQDLMTSHSGCLCVETSSHPFGNNSFSKFK